MLSDIQVEVEGERLLVPGYVLVDVEAIMQRELAGRQMLRLGVWALAAGSACAQAGGSLSGQVTDALQGTPIARALVRVNARSVLTDAEGRFNLPGFVDAQAFASVTKPGYSSSTSASEGPAMTRVADLTVPILLKLYPDAVISGTVNGRDGQPLGKVGVQLLRANFDAAGLSAVQVRTAQTDSHGNYRFREPAGFYRVAVRYVGAVAETGQSILPEEYPSEPAFTSAGYFTARPGQVKRVDLRPETGVPQSVTLRVDGATEERTMERRDGGMRLFLRTSAGGTFSTEARGTGQQGELQLGLPAGSYDLRVTAGGRGDGLEGQVHINVSSSHANQAQVHLSPLAVIPIEASFETSAGSSNTVTQPPTVQQLNLSLFSLTDNNDANADLRPRVGEDKGYEFRVPAGRYRLAASSTGVWSVRSALAGASNLMTGDLTVSSNSAGFPVRLVVSNAAGKVSGTVALGAGGVGWLYLVPSEPRLTPFVLERIGTTGAFTRSVAPGNYTALVVDQRLEADLHDARVRARVVARGKPVQVVEGGTATLELEVQAAGTVVE